MLRAIKPINRMPSRGTSSPTDRLINSCNSGLRVLNGLNCFGTEVRKLTTKRVTNVANQMVVASGMTTSKPAIRSFFRSCCNRTLTGGSDRERD